MAITGRLAAVLAYKAQGAVPKIIYLGYDNDEALRTFEREKEKGYFEIRVCRNIDMNWTSRFKADPVPVQI
jgi:hypothetical protein